MQGERIGDMIEEKESITPALPECELRESRQADQDSVPIIHTEVEQDYELNQAMNFDRKQGTEESSTVEKNLVDPSISCHTAIEEP